MLQLYPTSQTFRVDSGSGSEVGWQPRPAPSAPPGPTPTPLTGGFVKLQMRLPLLLAAALLLAAPSFAAVDAPFWTGKPDAASFATQHQKHVTDAKAEIAKMLAVKGKRTVENTLRPYDAALIHLDASSSQASLMESVHPDSV